jgi:hypothetical protein
MWWIYILVAVIPLVLLALRFTQAFPGGLDKGDFLRVAVPRTAEDGPLAMGTRLDVAASLKKSGVPMDQVRAWIDARDDAAMLERYWELQDAAEERKRTAN